MARDLNTQLTTAINNVTSALQTAYNQDLSDFNNSDWKNHQQGVWDGISDQVSGHFGHTVEVPVVTTDEPWFAMMGGVDTDQHVTGYQNYLENLKILMYAKWEANPIAAAQIGTQSLDGGGFYDGYRDLLPGGIGTADVSRDELTITGPALKDWAKTEYLDQQRAYAPETLGDTAEDWGTINSAELQPLHGHVSQMQVPTLWSGPGAEAYSKGIQPQGEAIGQIVTLVGQVNSILATGANGLESLYLAVIQVFDQIEMDILNCVPATTEDIGPRMRTALTSMKYALRYLQQDLAESVADWGGTIEDAEGQAADALKQDRPFSSHGGAWPKIDDISDMEPSAAMPGATTPTTPPVTNPTTPPPATSTPATPPGSTYTAPGVGTIKD